MSWTIGGVALPISPKVVMKTVSASPKSLTMPAAKKMLLSLGKNHDVLQLEGEFSGDKSTIESTYITPFEGKVYTEVTIAAPDSRYDGDWIMTKFVCREISGATRYFMWKMEFWMGSSHIVIT